jgi:hypothetical protein
MKKIYMVSCLLATLFMFTGKNLQAQCDNAAKKVFHLKSFGTTGIEYIVFVEGFTPNSLLNLFDANLNIVSNGTFTDATGKGFVKYTLPFAPVNVCSLPLNQSCCVGSVPPLEVCPAILPPIRNVIYTVPPICCIYTRTSTPGELIRLFDPNGINIPVTPNPGLNIDDLICLTYDCNRIPATLTVCNPSGCCSRPVPPQAPLPVRLTGFSVSLLQGTIQLNWGTSLEVGSKSFVIEKSSNGRDFSAIGEVDAAGSTYLKMSYSFIDNAVAPGASYYRLRMVDIDGQFEYSRIVYINNGKSGTAVTVGPNPFIDYIQLIGISSSELTRTNVQIFNAMGQQLSYRITGANAIALEESAPKGLYILKVKNQQFKIVKQ